MFERFTDRARRAVVLAQEQARSLNHSFIGTEHLLLGLLAESEGVAARALRELGVQTETVRDRIMEEIGSGGPLPEDQIPFTPRAKKAMELSLQEALRLGHNYIGTEHLLLGLLRETEGIACRVLTGMGIELDAVRRKVVELLSAIITGQTSAPVPAPPGASAPTTRHSPALAAALAHAAALAGEGLVGTHHLLAALLTSDEAAAAQVLEAGGFDASSLPAGISEWNVRGTGDEDPVERAARGTVVIQDASGMTVRLEDERLRARIEHAISTGNVTEDQLRTAFGRVWAEFAGEDQDPSAEAGPPRGDTPPDEPS